MNALRIIALSVLLASGGAMAQAAPKKLTEKQKKQMPNIPSLRSRKADRPKTCADQCKVLEKVMVDPCSEGADQQAGPADVHDESKQVVDACEGSARRRAA